MQVTSIVQSKPASAGFSINNWHRLLARFHKMVSKQNVLVSDKIAKKNLKHIIMNGMVGKDLSVSWKGGF